MFFAAYEYTGSEIAQTIPMEKAETMFKTKLPNGMRIIGERMPGFSSVSLGVWINAGSVYEREGELGMAHFIEHMLFKGTKTRSASRLAEEMDAIGGNLNAFTAKECTCFYGRVLTRHMGVLTEAIADMLENSLLAEEDIEREKGVVCEEISMAEDTPEDLVMETAISAFYEGDPLSRPILGTQEGVRAFTRSGLVRYMERLYKPSNTVIAAAGEFDEDELVSLAEKLFGEGRGEAEPPAEFALHTPKKSLKFIKKDIEQVHICICLPGFKKDTPESYAQLLFSNAFGGTMSSRLFQKIREERGLAYSVYSYPTVFPNSGFMTLYAGTGAENAADVAEMMLEELYEVRRNGLTGEELERAKNQLIASYLMSRESTSARASALGRAELLQGSVLSPEEVISRINAVDMAGIEAILPTVCSVGDFSACAVGRTGKCESRLRKLLAAD